MSIEANLNEVASELRQLTIAVETAVKVIQSIGAVANVPTNINTTPVETATTMQGEEVEITVADYGELDAMGCPFDPKIMGTNRTKNKTGALAGCWKKKKDVAYTNEMYLADRRLLIQAVQSSKLSSIIDDDSIDDDLPPQTATNTAPPPPPLSAVTEDYSELPSIPNYDLITNDEFVELCRVFSIKHGDDGSRVIADNMRKCGFGAESTPANVLQQDQLTWISKRLVDHDATHA